jgi:aldehyde dehydrogenase (NAD+)
MHRAIELVGPRAVGEQTRDRCFDLTLGFGGADLSTVTERESVGNLKRTFVDHGRVFDWFDASSEGLPFLRQAVQVKNIWIPYGD